MKLNYSDPKIYTGGVDIDQWSKLSKKEQKAALDKNWYVYYRYRNPETGKLVKQTNLKLGANRHKDKTSRYHILKQIKLAIEIVLQEGYNPYGDNGNLKEYLENRVKDKTPTIQKPVIQNVLPTPEPYTSIKHAFETGLKVKAKVLADDSFKKFRNKIVRFEKWLKSNGITNKNDIKSITKKIVIQYLNDVLQETSARTRNNTRADLATFFKTLEQNEIITYNFIQEIDKLHSTPTRNKTYPPELFNKIDAFLKKEDMVMRLYIQFIYFGLLRPIEVCRLTIGDLDLVNKTLCVKAKNQPVKTKIIPEILISELPDLSKYHKSDVLFNMNGIGGLWDINETNKRDYYTKKFKKVKDHFELHKDYTLYSYRHTAIGKLYRELEKNLTPHEVKSQLMHITGHGSMQALESYLRGIDASLPKDYSKHLE